MAQQTRLETVAAYHQRFLELFPSLGALAAAEEDEVLKAWEGLGYYARARNLRRAAQQTVERHGGRLPGDVPSLRALAGIGPYTAGAVASIAFGAPEPAVDGNARRVFSRLFDLAEPTPRRLDAAGRSLLEGAPGRPGATNQAIMDLGSDICTPQNPRCDDCPVSYGCRALAADTVSLRPPRKPRKTIPERREAAAIVWRGSRVLAVRRPADGLLGGLWDFPNTALATDVPSPVLESHLIAEFGIRAVVGRHVGTLRHTFSHFRLQLVVHDAEWIEGEVSSGRPHRWACLDDLETLAFPVYLRRLIFETLSSRLAGRAGTSA